ncbi:hypothetical protein AAG906_028372 [Vitis piasezkii]
MTHEHHGITTNPIPYRVLWVGQVLNWTTSGLYDGSSVSSSSVFEGTQELAYMRELTNKWICVQLWHHSDGVPDKKEGQQDWQQRMA